MEVTPLTALIGALAVARLTHLVTVDDWPLGALRDWLRPDAWLARMMTCPWCASMWIAAVWVTWWAVPAGRWWWAFWSTILAFSFVAGVLDDWFTDREP